MFSTTVIVCARCTSSNEPSNRFCAGCGLPLGSTEADANAVLDVLGAYEFPEPSDGRLVALASDLVERSGFQSRPFGHGWRLIVPLALDRRQAVYVGLGGTDAEGRALLELVSVCGPVNERDARVVLKLNARMVEGHFAIKVLRGEEYFVVLRNIAAEAVPRLDAEGLARRIAETADGLEDRLSRGRDLY